MDSFTRFTILFFMLILPCVEAVQRCACSKNAKDCSKINQMPVDFQTARENCKEQGGQLMSVRSEESDELVGFLLDNMIGNFWIGLYLPKGKCSSNTSVLRVYEWTGGAQSTGFANWASESTSCSPLCVSVSSDRRWVERSCDEKLDGFLCESKQSNLCKRSGSSSVVILDKEKCLYAPCEHTCTPVRFGYTCSCRNRFLPNEEDPRRCDVFCASSVCKAFCLRDGSCWCPAGFVKSGSNCEDIDECESNHDCSQICINTIGSYTCACQDPFILVHGTECTLTPSAFEGFHLTFPPDQEVTTPSSGSLSTAGDYAGLIIFILLALLLVVILVLRYLRSRKKAATECNAEFQESVSK